MEPASLTSLEAEGLKRHAERIMNQWISLREKLKEADSSVVFRFCLCLQILALSLYPDYSTTEARELLGRDETSMLQVFFEKEEGPCPGSFDHAQAGHLMALVHGLFELSGGKQSAFWNQLDDQYSAFDNQSMYGLMVDVTGMNSLGEAHAEQLYHAVLRSRLLAGKGVLRFDMFLDIFGKCQDVISPSLYRCDFRWMDMCGSNVNALSKLH